MHGASFAAGPTKDYLGGLLGVYRDQYRRAMLVGLE